MQRFWAEAGQEASLGEEGVNHKAILDHPLRFTDSEDGFAGLRGATAEPARPVEETSYRQAPRNGESPRPRRETLVRGKRPVKKGLPKWVFAAGAGVVFIIAIVAGGRSQQISKRRYRWICTPKTMPGRQNEPPLTREGQDLWGARRALPHQLARRAIHNGHLNRLQHRRLKKHRRRFLA